MHPALPATACFLSVRLLCMSCILGHVVQHYKGHCTALKPYTLQVERPDQLSEIVPQKRLADKVSGILSRIEAELDAVDEKIGERMHILDLDNDGLVSCVIHPTYSCPTYNGLIYSVWRWRPYCCS